MSDRISEIDIKGNHDDMLFRPFLRLKQEFSARREVEDNSLFGQIDTSDFIISHKKTAMFEDRQDKTWIANGERAKFKLFFSKNKPFVKKAFTS